MTNHRGDKYNGSDYYDPTAYHAIKNADRERDAVVDKVIKTIQSVAHLAGFDIVGRITLKDHTTGKVWR